MTTIAQTRVAIRQRWRQLKGDDRAESVLGIALLASYTIDPIVPYLGVGLHDVELPSDVRIGPYHQIVQECLNDDGQIGRWRPDVLVVAPRFEEFGPDADLPACAEVALAAAQRWGCYLVFVLPGLPDEWRRGIGDLAGGSAWSAAAAMREQLRNRMLLAGAGVVDADAAIREVGSQRAYHAELFAYARVPYVEDVYARLAEQVTALLRLRYRGCVRAVVLDADRLGQPNDALLAQLKALHERRVRIAVVGRGKVDELCRCFLDAAPELVRDAIAAWVVDDREVNQQVAEVATRLGVSVDECVILTQPDVPATAFHRPIDVSRTSIDVSRMSPAAGPATPAARVAADASPSVVEYVAGLAVNVELTDLNRAELGHVADVVERAKDLTLGLSVDYLEAMPDPPRQVMVARVRDRLGDYGISAAVAYTMHDDVCTVDLLSVSCQVLGKGVEDRILAAVAARAASQGLPTLRLRYYDDGRNRVGVEFARTAATRTWSVSDSINVRVVAEAVAAR